MKRRYQLERKVTLFLHKMLKGQWSGFIADMKAGTPPEEAIAKLDNVSEGFKEQMLETMTQASTYGVKQAQAGVVGSVGLDWHLVNEDARKWAEQYAYSKIVDVNETSRRVLREKVSNWIVSGKPLPELIRDKKLVYLFGPKRAKMIAITEVTRAYAEANQMVFQQAGVKKRRWNTGNDELVCLICRPLNGKVVDINEPFPGGIMLPPAHPNCRCWITPVVEEDATTPAPLPAVAIPSAPVLAPSAVIPTPNVDLRSRNTQTIGISADLCGEYTDSEPGRAYLRSLKTILEPSTLLYLSEHDTARLAILERKPELVSRAIQSPDIIYKQLDHRLSGHWRQAFVIEDSQNPGHFVVVVVSLANLAGENNSEYHKVVTMHPVITRGLFKRTDQGLELRDRWMFADKQKTGG